MEATGSGALLQRVRVPLRRPTGDGGLMSVKDRPMSVKMGDGFKDQGHLRYYASSTSRCGLKKEEKRKMKLVKGLEKDLSALYSMGFGVERGEGIAGEVKDQIMSEAAEVLLAQLTKLRAEAKEMKIKRKQEKAAMKAAKMAAKVKNRADESSSSSSESSDRPSQIEVCMGGKCKKSGAMELMAEFEKKVGIEGAVVGCKCMGKCREGPNVRFMNQRPAVVAGDGPLKAGKGPLCIGVGLEDVGSIVADFFGERKEGLGFVAA
ncbi:uncharacterized protein A4U43_C07F11390 [Asparagus officinalis]|uniref:Uncharacterized protein n=1 Tax=Asparagus officinalis TaxID=4686 RepID=A0A5P1ED18_ASPOF|nr:uncharacterized protein A4U43_C07F11390 [Asparagus officinalis]